VRFGDLSQVLDYADQTVDGIDEFVDFSVLLLHNDPQAFDISADQLDVHR